jgi:hypothetical protein
VATQPFVFVRESIGKRGSIVERQGLRGTRSHTSDDTRIGTYSVGGTLLLEPTPEDLAIWLPRILGGSPSGTTYPLAESLPSFDLMIDRVSKVFTYTGCKVARASFGGSQGGLLQLSLEIVGKTESVGAAGTFPSLTLQNTPPYIFSDLVLTLQSATREVRSFELSIDNALVRDRFMNSVTVTDIPEGDRVIRLRTTHGYTAGNTDLYEQALAGAAGTLVLTNSLGGAPPVGYQTTFTFGTLQVPSHSPAVNGREEILLALDMIARKTSGSPELSVVHDSTP